MDPLFGNFDEQLIDLARRVNDIDGSVKAVAPLLNESAISMMGENFENQRAGDGPKWAKHSPVTIERRRKGKGRGSAKLLIDTGLMFGGRQADSSEGKTEIGNAMDYAGIHQTGADKVAKQKVPAGTIKAHRVKAHSVSQHRVPRHQRRSRKGKVHTVKAHTVKAHRIKAHTVGAHDHKAYVRTVHIKIPARPQDWTARTVDRMLGFIMDYQLDGSI